MESTDRLSGFADLHLHQFAQLAFGGRVLWGSASGDPAEALRSCREEHGRHGVYDWVGNLGRVLFLGGPWTGLLGHDTRGFPDFAGWPAWQDFTHQSAHEKWLRRAVDGGLRLAVVLALHNRVLCRLSRSETRTCDDLVAVDRQLAAAHELEAQIDAACGGHDRGWYRIVRSPEQARAVIASGRLAVVLGIEVDDAFGGGGGDPTPASVAAAVEHYHQAGVRHVIPFHFSDTAFGGAAFALPLQWSTNHGPISGANPVLSLPVYRMRTLPRREDGYRYRAGNCNSQSLTELGSVLLRELMSRGMVIDVDHMSTATRSGVLDVTGAHGYPVIASHTEFADLSRPELRSERQLRQQEVARIRAGGGTVAPLLRQATVKVRSGAEGTREAFLAAYRHTLATGPEWVGFGSDFNGFAGAPRPGSEATLSYPFPAPLGGVPMDRDHTGRRTFDLSRDGVAHVGMLLDFVADLGTGGLTSDELAPLLRSAAGYVELWERALAAS